MLNLNNLSCFVMVADHQGFAAASRALSIPKSTLARRIADLERDLGVRLIHRTSRAFAITAIGRELYRHALAMLIEAEAAENMLKGHLSEPNGTVRLTTSIIAAQMLLADILPDIALRYPTIQIILHATDRFVDLVQEGFDIAVRAHYAPLQDSDLIQRRVGSSQNCLVTSRTYFDRRAMPQEPRELEAHDGLLSAVTGNALTWSLRNGQGISIDVRPSCRFVSDEPATLMRAAMAGLGIAALPSALCAPEIDAGSLLRILPDWNMAGATVTILTPHRRGQLPSVRAVVELLAERLSSKVAG